MLHVCCNNKKKISGMKPGSNRNETGQHPEWARCDWSSSEKLGSELARSSSEFLGATWSSSDHYTVSRYTVTASLRGYWALFSSKARSVPRQPSRANKSFLQKTWRGREPALAIKLKPSNKLDCKIRRVYAVFRRIVETPYRRAATRS